MEESKVLAAFNSIVDDFLDRKGLEGKWREETREDIGFHILMNCPDKFLASIEMTLEEFLETHWQKMNA